jgi:hypothetical protein
MSNHSLTGEDMFQSLTGFDEIAIAQQFGIDLSELRKRPFMFMRALAFTDLRRKGQRDTDAKQAAMELTMGELTHYFAEDDEADLGDDGGELGKDEPSPSGPPS